MFVEREHMEDAQLSTSSSHTSSHIAGPYETSWHNGNLPEYLQAVFFRHPCLKPPLSEAIWGRLHLFLVLALYVHVCVYM